MTRPSSSSFSGFPPAERVPPVPVSARRTASIDLQAWRQRCLLQ